MALSRKRSRELKRLGRTAEELWEEQRQVIENAAGVVREAGRQVSAINRELVVPRIRDGYERNVVPAVGAGLAAGRHVADAARTRLTGTILPAMSTAMGSALAVLEASKDPRVRSVVNKARTRLVPPTPVKKSGPGRYILMALGVAAVAGVAYAAWQTLRADDELWIADAEEELDAL